MEQHTRFGLDHNSDLEQWRAVKQRVDKGRQRARDVLGCVGAPIADYIERAGIEETSELIDALVQARSNLAEYVRKHAQNEVDNLIYHLDELAPREYDPQDIEVDTNDTLADVAQRGFDYAVSCLSSIQWEVAELDPSSDL